MTTYHAFEPKRWPKQDQCRLCGNQVEHERHRGATVREEQPDRTKWRDELAGRIRVAALKAYEDCDCTYGGIYRCPHAQTAIAKVLEENGL